MQRLSRRAAALLAWPSAATKVNGLDLALSTPSFYREAVTFHSPGSPRSGAPWVTYTKRRTYPAGVLQWQDKAIGDTANLV